MRRLLKVWTNVEGWWEEKIDSPALKFKQLFKFRR
jgi:hypothetical protein